MNKRTDALLATLDHCVATPNATIIIVLSKHGGPPIYMADQIVRILATKNRVHLGHGVKIVGRKDTQAESSMDLSVRGAHNHEARIIIKSLRQKEEILGYNPSVVWVDDLLPLELKEAANTQSGRRLGSEGASLFNAWPD